MCDSLYVKANGELPCWDDVGEELIFRKLDAEKLRDGLERNIFHSPELLHIRESFLRGENPHTGLCERCAVRGHGGTDLRLRPKGDAGFTSRGVLPLSPLLSAMHTVVTTTRFERRTVSFDRSHVTGTIESVAQRGHRVNTSGPFRGSRR